MDLPADSGGDRAQPSGQLPAIPEHSGIAYVASSTVAVIGPKLGIVINSSTYRPWLAIT